MTTLYGIKNCDTVKKARKWLDAAGISYRFHDIRTDGLEPAKLTAWSQSVGWETILNRRGATWRQLPEAVKENINDNNILSLMLESPTLIKRPVLEHREELRIGFNEAVYQALFSVNKI